MTTDQCYVHAVKSAEAMGPCPQCRIDPWLFACCQSVCGLRANLLIVVLPRIWQDLEAVMTARKFASAGAMSRFRVSITLCLPCMLQLKRSCQLQGFHCEHLLH